jgi:hypothetical protein
MALIVKSGVGQLHTISMDNETAARVAQALVAEGRSFYVEPSGIVSTIFVDTEHAERVRELRGTTTVETNGAAFEAKVALWLRSQEFGPEDLDVDYSSADQQDQDGFVYLTAMVSLSVPISALR